MSVIVKGDSPFDAFIVSRIKDCHTEHIKFYDISFNCKTIEDADGRVFTRREERKKGKWIGTEFDGYADGSPVYYEWKCSACGCVVEDEEPAWNFCPNCGADMRGEKNEFVNRICHRSADRIVLDDLLHGGHHGKSF